MKSLKLLTIMLFILPLCAKAQITEELADYGKISGKYVRKVDNKVSLYSKRVKSKTRKTLTRLVRWEKRIYTLLQKVSPETAGRLFAPGQPTFNTLLEKLNEGEAIERDYKAKFDNYRDKLSLKIDYLNDQKSLVDGASKKLNGLKDDIKKLDSIVGDSEATEKFIRERKRQLIQQSLQYIGKSKYLTKLNKDAYYYSETLRNYKEIFSDPKKVEELATRLLNRIPAFKNFTSQQTQMSGLFASPSGFATIPAGTSIPIVSGLPTRADMQQFIGANAPTIANANMNQFLNGNVSEVKAALEKIKGYASGGNMNNDGLPDFKPNNQKAKPFSKRLEYNTDLQFGSAYQMMPSSATLALGVGYKFTDNNSAGIGISYTLGLGRGWDSLRFSHQGLGLRTYIKTKLKKGFAIQGGAEWNYRFTEVKSIPEGKEPKWKASALLGISKAMSIGGKAKSNIQLYYDFLHNKHVPVSQPFVFRYGYNLNMK